MVFFAPEAEADLSAIHDWIAGSGDPEVAFAYVERVVSKCRSLDLASSRGRARDDIRPSLRVVGFERRLTIAFVVDADRVTVLRIFAAGRDWEGEFR